MFRNLFSNILQYVIVSLHFFGPCFCFRIWGASIKGTFTSSMGQNLSLFQKQFVAVVLIQHHVFVPCQSGGFSLRYGTPLGNWYGTREFYMSKHFSHVFRRCFRKAILESGFLPSTGRGGPQRVPTCGRLESQKFFFVGDVQLMR